MGFTTGAKPLADIIDEIANSLIAAGNWSNVSAYWNTAVRDGDKARRALKFESGAEKIYLALEAINEGKNMGWNQYAKGIRITFSAMWDTSLDSYPSSNQMSFVPFESGNGRWPTADLANLSVTYWLWVERNGFVLLGKPEPRDYDNWQQSFYAVVERNPNKEYADGQSNFYFHAMTNIGGYHNSGIPLARMKYIMRPFAFTFPADNVDYTGQDPVGRGGLILMPVWWSVGEQPYWIYTFKSPATNKVYYIEPILCNSRWINTPIMQAKLWFRWTEEQGLIDGDIVAVEEGAVRRKYLCKAVDSPDSGGRLIIAMKYAEEAI